MNNDVCRVLSKVNSIDIICCGLNYLCSVSKSSTYIYPMLSAVTRSSAEGVLRDRFVEGSLRVTVLFNSSSCCYTNNYTLLPDILITDIQRLNRTSPLPRGIVVVENVLTLLQLLLLEQPPESSPP